MTIEEQFADAQARVKTLPAVPGADVLLQLYALYKQGAVGDVDGGQEHQAVGGGAGHS